MLLSNTGTAAILTTGLALIFGVVALVVPYWLVVDYGYGKIHMGLWQACTSFIGDSVCVSTNGMAGETNVAMVIQRTLMVIGVIFTLLALVVSKWAVFDENRSVAQVSSSFCLAASMCILIVVSSFLKSTIPTGLASAIHIGMPLAAIAGILNLAASFLFRKSRAERAAATVQPMGFV